MVLPFSVTTVSIVFLALDVGEVGPRAEHAQRPQLATVLVRHEIVGVVRTRAGVLVAAENLAREQAAGDDAIGAVLVARDALENGVDVILREPRSLAVRATEVAFGSIDDFFGSKVVRNDSTWL